MTKYKFFCLKHTKKEHLGVFECSYGDDPHEVGALIKKMSVEVFNSLYYIQKY